VRKVISVLMCVTILTVMFGCASIVNGTSQDIKINSNPAGAQVSINGQNIAVTPAVVTLKRGSDHTLVFDKEGYNSVTLHINKEFNSWVLGNLIIGGIIGIIIDFSNGAAYKLSPEEVNATFTKKQIKEFGINLEIDGNEYQVLVVDSAVLD